MKMTFDIPGIKTFLKELEDDGIVESGVSAEGPAAAYALVWEFGNLRQTKKGPKTVLGVNPRGERVWLSSQAPYGYIWTNTQKFLTQASQELEKVTFKGTTKRETTEELERASIKAVERMAGTVSESAPVDSGQLSDSIRAVEPGDALLEENE